MLKGFYYALKDPCNDPPIDPDFPADYGDDMIEFENEDVSSSGGPVSLTPEQRTRLRAFFKTLHERDRIIGRKAE